MSMYQKILINIIFASFLIDLIHGSLIVFNLIQPPTAQAILLTVMAIFTVIGVFAAVLLFFSFVKK